MIKVVVGLDALRPPRTGIGTYASYLAEHLLPYVRLWGLYGGRIIQPDEMNRFLEASKNDPSPKCSGIQTLARRLSPLYHLGKWIQWSRHTRALGALPRETIYHEPATIAPHYMGRQVITLHDLSHIRHPHTHPTGRVAFLKRHLARTLREADAVITGCEFIRQEALELGLVDDPKKIHAIGHGISEGFYPRAPNEVRPLLHRYELKWRSFILSVATLEPRKNLQALIEAYCALPRELASTFALVLVGAQGWKNEQFNKIVAQVKPPYRIVVTGYLHSTQVQNLAASAALFAYPSLYEGFGLPVLEAMASQTAVLTSAYGALGEVSGGAAYQVDTASQESLNKALHLLLENEGLRSKLGLKGLNHAKKFSWQRCAQETFALYQSL